MREQVIFEASGVDSDTLSVRANANLARTTDGSGPTGMQRHELTPDGNAYGRPRGRAVTSRCNSGLASLPQSHEGGNHA